MKFMVKNVLEVYEKIYLKINEEKSTFYMGYVAETTDLIIENQNGPIRGREEFE